MKNNIIGWIANVGGFNKVWAFLDGKKTYAAAGLGMLTSIVGLAHEVLPILSAHNTAGLIGWIQQLPTDTSWLSLMASFGLLGLGHKAVKASAPPVIPDGPVQPEP